MFHIILSALSENIAVCKLKLSNNIQVMSHYLCESLYPVIFAFVYTGGYLWMLLIIIIIFLYYIVYMY